MAIRLADFYRGLAELLRAGVVVGQALADLRANGTLPAAPGIPIQQAVQQGQPLSEALARFPDDFPAADIALLEAGEATGRLDRTLDRLASLHDLRRRAWRDLALRSLYPIFVGHFAAFTLPVARLASQRQLTLGSWLGEVAVLLLPFWGLVLLLFYLHRFAVWRERFRAITDHLPGFGAAARHRRRATLAAVLQAAYEAGLPLDRSLTLAARAAHEPRALAAATAVAAGKPLTAALEATRLLTLTTLSRIATGEEAGEISKALRQIAQEENTRADTLFNLSMLTLAALIFLTVVGWIGWSIIAFYTNLYSQYGTVSG